MFKVIVIVIVHINENYESSLVRFKTPLSKCPVIAQTVIVKSVKTKIDTQDLIIIVN